MRKHFFWVSTFIILVAAIFLRFSRYSDRWGLAYDQAHDATIARFALTSNQLPLLGPFSSAGPFQTSGVWYWIIMMGTLVYPQSVISPWIFLTLLYVGFVLGMILLGKILVDETFGILTGIVTCVSTAQIAQSVNLTNQTPLALTSLLALFCFVFYAKTKRARYVFFLGFFVSLSASIHLQGVSLISLVFVALFFLGIPSVSSIVYLGIGLLIPILPIFIFDSTHQFINTKNMIHYVLVDQYRISLNVLGRRWQTFAGTFLPYEWSHIIGGKTLIGGVLFIGSMLVLPFQRITKNRKIILGIVLSTVMMFVVLRYTRTPLFSSYVVFLHPFVLLLSSLVLYYVIKKNFIVGVTLCIIVLTFSLQKSLEEINYGVNLSDQQARYWRNVLVNKFPVDKFSIYDYKQQANASSITFALYLDAQNKISSSGKKIAVSLYPPITATPSGELLLVDGDKGLYEFSPTDEQEITGWGRVNPEDIYNSTENWAEK